MSTFSTLSFTTSSGRASDGICTFHTRFSRHQCCLMAYPKNFDTACRSCRSVMSRTSCSLTRQALYASIFPRRSCSPGISQKIPLRSRSSSQKPGVNSHLDDRFNNVFASTADVESGVMMNLQLRCRIAQGGQGRYSRQFLLTQVKPGTAVDITKRKFN